MFYITYEELILTDIFGIEPDIRTCQIVLHYLWGIDTLLIWSFVIFFSFCFTLPMRNWYSNIPHCLKISNSFTLPMRNWYWSSFTLISLNVSAVLHYLWGIDTKYPHHLARFLRFCFTLPIRNWYNLKLLLSFYFPPGFYITYKELIPLLFNCLNCICSFRFTLPIRNWYVIRPSITTKFIMIFCFTLPIRNWYTFCTHYCYCCNLVLHYL